MGCKRSQYPLCPSTLRKSRECFLPPTLKSPAPAKLSSLPRRLLRPCIAHALTLTSPRPTRESVPIVGEWQPDLPATRLVSSAPAVSAPSVASCPRRTMPPAPPADATAWPRRPQRLQCQVLPSTAIPDLQASLPAAAEAANSLQPHLTISWLRTLANGWQTTSRMQEQPRRCPWGCDANDALPHNLQCTWLRSRIDAAAGTPSRDGFWSRRTLDPEQPKKELRDALLLQAAAQHAYASTKPSPRL